MLNKICMRLVFSTKTVSKSYSELYKICSISCRPLSMSKPLLSVKQGEITPVKIYNGLLSSQVRAVKAFSLSSSIIGLVAQPVLYKAIVCTGSTSIIIATYTLVGFFTLISPLLLHFVTKKYVTSLEYITEEDKYIAHTINFFCFSSKLEFKVEDVQVPELPGMFTTIKAKGKALFLEPSHFDNPDHYAILMGFNKPMDFKMTESSSLNKTKCE